jgi:heat shock protein HslJ
LTGVHAGRVLLIAALIAAGSACSESNLLTAPTAAARVDGTWRLVQLTSDGVSLTEAPTAGRFSMTLADDRVLLKAECNTCAGNAALSGDVLTFTTLACTRAVCASAPLDLQFAQAVVGSHTVRLDATRLHLTSSRGEIRFQR